MQRTFLILAVTAAFAGSALVARATVNEAPLSTADRIDVEDRSADLPTYRAKGHLPTTPRKPKFPRRVPTRALRVPRGVVQSPPTAARTAPPAAPTAPRTYTPPAPVTRPAAPKPQEDTDVIDF